jgi:hypothetical protein
MNEGYYPEEKMSVKKSVERVALIKMRRDDPGRFEFLGLFTEEQVVDIIESTLRKDPNAIIVRYEFSKVFEVKVTISELEIMVSSK